MGCGCNKRGGARNSVSNRPVGPRSIRSAARPLTQVVRNQIAAQKLEIQAQSKSPSGLNEERRSIEKLRRDAIRRALGK